MVTRELVGSRIKHFRLLRGYSQEQLARRLNIKQEHVSRLELGRQGQRSLVILRIAAALDIKPWALFMTAREYKQAEKRGLV